MRPPLPLPPRAGQNGISFSPRGLAVAPLGGWGNLRYRWVHRAVIASVLAGCTRQAVLLAHALVAYLSALPQTRSPVPPLWPRSANAAFVALLHAKHTSDASVRSACLSWAQRQLDYMLGLAGSER